MKIDNHNINYLLLSKLPFFQTLSKPQLDKVMQISHLKHYSKGYILYYEKSQLSYVYFLIDGLAKVYKVDKYENEIFLYHLESGSMLCEISSLDNLTLPTSTNLILEKDSTILSINYEKFKKEFIDTKLLDREITQEIIKQSNRLRDLIDREFVFDSIAKVAMMLDSSLDMFNSIKRYDASLILHIQPATLSRVLNRLKRDKIIDIIHGKVIVIEKIKLQKLYKDNI